MKMWQIAWKDVRIRLRDRKGFLMMIAMPLVLTAILGAALGGVFDQERNSMPQFELAVYQGDDGEIGKRLVEDVFKSEELKQSITVKSLDSEEAVQKLVADGEAGAGIVIPKGFSEQVMSGQKVQVRIVQDPGNPQTAAIVRGIVTSYTDRVSVVSTALASVIGDLNQSVSASAFGKPDVRMVAQEVTGELSQTAASPNVAVIEKPVGEKAVSAKQYYAAAMAVMFLLFNATIGAKSILNERATETLSRLLSTPTSKLSILMGKFMGTLLFSLLQFGVLLLVTRYALGVEWGSQPGQIFAVVCGYAAAVSGLSMALASVLKSEQAADVVSGVGVQIFALLGGSMLPLSQFPDFLQNAALLTPNAWALTSLTDIMTGTTWQALFLPIGVLFATGAVGLSVGTWRLTAR
jgi:ABC-2 type transport system permease protein